MRDFQRVSEKRHIICINYRWFETKFENSHKKSPNSYKKSPNSHMLLQTKFQNSHTCDVILSIVYSG